MGYTKHHAIIVTSWDKFLINCAYGQAVIIFKERVSSIIESPVNGWRSFFIASDGSKEFWPESDEGDEQRKDFINWINAQKHVDGSNSLQYAEVSYDDERKCKITNHN